MKRTLSFILALVMLIGLMPLNAFATETTEATESTEATEVTEATEATDATEATEVTEITEPTEATEVTEGTGVAEETEAVAVTDAIESEKRTVDLLAEMETPDSLDNIAWEDLTYRDIFITNNLAYVDGFNQKSYEPFYQKLGQNEITNEAYYTAPYSLYAGGNGSQYLQHSVTLPEAGDYFVASKAKCIRYVQGTLGMCLYSTAVGVQGVTEDFVTTAQIVTERKGAGIFVGSFKTADLDGYVDDPVVVNMAIFDTVPTLEQLEALYENYVAYEKAQPREEIPYTDGEMLDAFMEYMNGKAASIGMTGSQFNDPVGMDNLTTASDLMRLMVYAYSNYGDLNAIWGTDDYTISVGGISNRDHVLERGYWDNPYLEPYYHIIGAKGGSLLGPKIYNFAAILEIPNSDDKLAVVALYSEGAHEDANGSRAAVKQVADAAMIKYLDPTADNSNAEVCCQSAIACLIPAEGANLSDLRVLYSKDADTQRAPASISKVLTAICVLDLQKDLSNTITYKSADTDIGGFYVKDFVPGETVTYEDAMYALMLKSSNVTAMALARSSGESILKEEISVPDAPEIHTHSYTTAITAPTCTAQGYTTYTCACGDSYVDDYVDDLGHSYESGICTACGVNMSEQELTLDSVAWKNLTYRDIFITNNLAYLDGFNNRTFAPYIQHAGTNTIATDACYTEPYSLAAFGSTSQQIKSVDPLPIGDYFIASKVYCTRYAAGELGVCLSSITIGVTEVTDGFVTTSAILSATKSSRIFIGSIHSADLDGYVDDTVVVDMSIFATKPTEAELTALYEQYVEIEKAVEREEVPFTEQEMLDAFVVYMNEKAASIGMTNSSFVGPIGTDNITTAADLLRLLIYAYTNYEELNGIWGQSSHAVTVSGEKAREQTVVSTVIKPALEDYYHILGGKTGTLSKFNARNLAVILEIPESDDRLAVIALYADGLDTDSNNRFEAVRQIADAALAKYFDPSVDNSATDVCCASAIACLVPADGVDLGDLEILYEKDSETQRVPASITKVLAAICALDIMDDLTQTVTYSDFDTQIGGYYTKDFYPGDSISFEDALYAMMLPSSNVTARMVARVAGEIILEEGISTPDTPEVHIHNYSTKITAPTCAEQGYTTYTCTCGDSYVDDYVDATGHNYENDICTACGEAQPGPVITLQPENVSAAIGEKFAVTVEAEGEGLTYQWYYSNDGGKSFAVSSFKSKTYAMTMATYCHNRQVYCVITDANGNDLQSEIATITAPLTITKQPADVQVEIGQKASISVSAVGDGLRYQWYYKDRGSKEFKVSSYKGKTYSMTMAEWCHMRQVYCVITDAYGNTVTTEIATMSRPPLALTIVTQPQDVQVEIGEKANITVVVQGEGLTYQWYYKDRGNKEFKVSSYKGNTYSMKMAEFCHLRQVYCVITDQYGNSVTSETATMTRPPVELKILTQPTDITAAVGEKFSVRFTVQGEGLTYQWYYKNKGDKTFKVSSFTGNRYSMTMANFCDGRQVYCVITDQYGNQVTTEVVTLTVEK